MHYCLMLFTREFPTKEKIDNMMKRYNLSENHDEYPQFTYDWYEIGGKFSGNIKLRVDFEDEKYRWQYYGEPRNGRLFWSYLLNAMQNKEKPFIYDETRYLCSMGVHDGFLYVDGAWIADTINFDEQNYCYTFMTDDGKAYSREWWNGDKHIPNDDFEERLKTEKDKAREENQFMTIIDYHD